MIKPRIYWSIRNRIWFCCAILARARVGDTPSEAYLNWKKHYGS